MLKTDANGYIKIKGLMISCNEATYLASRGDLEGLSFKYRMVLQMHLIACSACRHYLKQVRIITRSLNRKAQLVEKGVLSHRLSATEKAKLQRLIKNSRPK